MSIDGILLFSTFGHETFQELHASFQRAKEERNIKNEKEKYTSLIEEETKKNEEYKKIEENLNTADSYEAIARDDLGMLKSDETVYINPETN